MLQPFSIFFSNSKSINSTLIKRTQDCITLQMLLLSLITLLWWKVLPKRIESALIIIVCRNVKWFHCLFAYSVFWFIVNLIFDWNILQIHELWCIFKKRDFRNLIQSKRRNIVWSRSLFTQQILWIKIWIKIQLAHLEKDLTWWKFWW